MATKALTISPDQVVEAIVEYAIRPKESEFLLVPLGNGTVAKIHPYPLRVSREIRTTDGRSYTKREMVVYALTSEEDFGILDLLSTDDLRLKHVRFAENKAAAYSNEGQPYKQNVLVPWWTRTGQLIRLSNDTAIMKALALPIDPSASGTGQLITRDRRSLSGYSTKNIVIPTKTGFFTTISGDIPVDDDIFEERPDAKEISYWAGNYPDENGISTVGCGWGSGVLGLGAVAGGPLGRYDGGVLGIGADAPIKYK
ncbi:MAG: hypothetical protein HYW23_02650 [Candidatus Aenigmarchaeota archaeon]|nr:hypothetical protein [Candidatus Aenigmarchaeota archaeon]